jgi:hypothetical protein
MGHIRSFVTVALLSTAAPAFAANIVVNSGFESGALAPWFQDRNFGGGAEDWNVTNVDPHSGTFAATVLGNKEIRQNFAPTPVANITQASFWLRHSTQNNLPAFVSLFYSDLSETTFLVNTAGTGWEQFDVLGNLVAGKTLTGFSIFGYSGGQQPFRTYLDDVVFFAGPAIPEPATWALMIAGFGLAGTAARRSARTRVAFA